MVDSNIWAKIQNTAPVVGHEVTNRCIHSQRVLQIIPERHSGVWKEIRNLKSGGGGSKDWTWVQGLQLGQPRESYQTLWYCQNGFLLANHGCQGFCT